MTNLVKKIGAIALCFSLTAPGWAAFSKEEWARFTLDKGIPAGRGVSMEEWNGLLFKLENLSQKSAETDINKQWDRLLEANNIPVKPSRTAEEWKSLAASLQAATPAAVKTAAPAVPPPAPAAPPAVSTSPAQLVSLPGTGPAVLAPVVSTAPALAETPAVAVATVTAPAPTNPVAKPKGRPGENTKISLDLRQMDIVEVLKILSRQSGLNIVVGKNVSGRVTVFLTNVDFWEALQTVLETQDLAYVEEGGVLKVITASDYERIYGTAFGGKTQIKVLALKNLRAPHAKTLLEPFKSRVGNIIVNEAANALLLEDTAERIARMEQMAMGLDQPVETRVFALNYGTVDDMLPKISPMVSKDFGMIQADKRSNSFVITDNPTRMAEISKFIESFDVRNKAVLIEAKIVQVLLNDGFQWGINWQYAFNRVAGNSENSPIRGNVSSNFHQVPLSTLLPDANGNVTAKGITGNVKITELPHGATFNSIINFLESQGTTKMLSAPRIMALNRQSAHIHVGTKEPIITRTIINPGSTTTQPIVTEDVKFEPVGVKLAVTPEIGADGYMTMKISPEVSAVERTIDTENGSSIPIVRLSEAETSVVVKDGATIVIGGLIEDKKIRTDTKVPILGSLPLIGLFFRGRNDTIQKTELVIFLTPKITMGDETPREADVYLPQWKDALEPKKPTLFQRWFGR